LASACSTFVPTSDPTPQAEITREPTTAPTQRATPTTAPIAVPDAWACFGCPLDQLWLLDPEGARQVNVPATIGQYYDYDPASQRVLYASHFATVGAGPSNTAVSDLLTVELDGGSHQVWVAEDSVVEALWMPNGQDVVFVQASESDYELRLMGADGSSQTLAQHVAFTFSPSPDGMQIAFTRETGYGVDARPGLYILDVATGEERRISDFDRAGSGSIDDRPTWSSDGRFILLPIYGEGGPTLLLARSDGTFDAPLDLSQMTSDQDWNVEPALAALWDTDNGSLITVAHSGLPGMDATPEWIVRLTLAPDSATVVEGDTIAEASALIGWNVPGRSIWVLEASGSEPGLVTVPE
jgi:hypothetical protein